MTTDQLVRASASMPITLAADDDTGAKGAVKALVSAYGVKYRIGYATWHTIEADAFAESIAAQASIPLFWQHSWDWSEQPPIGHSSASEEPDGLHIDGEFYVDLDPEVARIYAAMKAGALREWSIGYQPIEIRKDTDDDRHFFVTKAELLEASVVLRGANPETQTLMVASRVLGREPTPEERELLAAGKPLPSITTSAPPPPQIDPDPGTTATPAVDLATVRKLYRL